MYEMTRGANERRPPNKRLKLPGPAVKGSVRLCANELAPQGGVLAPAGGRPAA